MMTSDRIALPGDPELDLDLWVKLSSVVCLEKSMLMTFSDGEGVFRSLDTGELTRVSEVDADAAFGLDAHSDVEVEVIVAVFELWQEAGDIVHLCGAPGKDFSFTVEDVCINLPRTETQP